MGSKSFQEGRRNFQKGQQGHCKNLVFTLCELGAVGWFFLPLCFFSLFEKYGFCFEIALGSWKSCRDSIDSSLFYPHCRGPNRSTSLLKSLLQGFLKVGCLTQFQFPLKILPLIAVVLFSKLRNRCWYTLTNSTADFT